MNKESVVMTWDEFKKWYDETIDSVVKRENYKPIIAFRGQASESWKLETTLERFIDTKIELKDYLKIIEKVYRSTIKNKHEFQMDINFPIKEIPEKPFTHSINNDIIKYLIFLRHHGFPSPLLDWSISPYVAAFFAFWDKNSNDNAKIYIYVNSLNGIRATALEAPHITPFEEIKDCHIRHKHQESYYTIASYGSGNGSVFCSHDTVFDPSKNIYRELLINEQDLLTEIEIPYTERDVVLSDLYQRNVTKYYLFQDSDSYYSALAYEIFKNI